MTASLRGISLFSGCGGLDLGFSNQGFTFDSAIECDPKAIETYNSNFKFAARQEKISKTTELEKNLDLIIAGPPCQGFSTAGGYNKPDPRNILLTTTCEIAAKSNARIIVIENVSGLTNKINIDTLNKAISILQNSNYFVDKRVLECENFGVPQRRRRLFIVARRNNAEFNLSNIPIQHPITLKYVLSKIDENDPFHRPIYLHAGSREWNIANAIKQGQKLCNVRASEKCVHTWDVEDAFGETAKTEKDCLLSIQRLRRQIRRRNFGDADPVDIKYLEASLGRDVIPAVNKLVQKGYLRRIGSYVDLTHTFNGKYRRLVWDGISPTVDTRFGDHRLFLHPLENRGMTIREAARIQGFPDYYKFPLNPTLAFRQIGNAVPPPVAESLAKLVKSLIQ